jgi:proline iminopeptidase
VQGIFTLRKSELDWSRLEPGPAARLYPDLFERFVSYLPESDRNDVYAGYYKLLMSEDRKTALAAASPWNTWDVSIGTILVDESKLKKIDEDDGWNLSHARLECQYFIHGGFMEDGYILRQENLDKIRHIPSESPLLHGWAD